MTDNERQQLLRRIMSDSAEESPSSPPAKRPHESDVNVLDAYSQAVIGVVETVSPAVIGIGPLRGEDRGGSGTGFLIAPDGYALTNSHVIDGSQRVTATTSDGDRIDATVVGDDPTTDLALVRLAARDLPFAGLGDSEAIRVGQLVIAMGNPLGFQSTVSTGVVSAVGRAMRGRQGRLIESVVQHTAPLNPGNSGGPLVDSRGRVVGVNTAIVMMAQGLGFAIPANTAKWVVGELLTHGKVRRSYLGVVGTSVAIHRRMVRELDLLSDRAVEVVEVEPRGPASISGVVAGDVIVAINGRVVASVDDLHRLLAAAPSGESMAVSIVRDQRLVELPVRPGLLN